MEKIVVVNKLSKTFKVPIKEEGVVGGLKALFTPKTKTIIALKRIAFSIDRGELVGFIGPNGAGKTTTMKILSGLLYPTAGTVQVLGFDPWERKPEFLKQIALVMGQKNQLWWDLPAIETFKLNKAIYEISDSDYKEMLDELIKVLDVQRLLHTQVRRVSLGQRMRLELVSALLHRPKVLFLDEPTIGLDLVGQQKIRDFIFEYNKRFEATIMLTSHNMDDLIDLAKRVLVIDKGQIIFDGPLRGLITEFAREKVIRVHLAKEADIKLIEKIGEIKNLDYPKVTIKVPRETVAVAAAELLQTLPVADLEIEEESIEEVIRRVFQGELGKKMRK